METRRPRHDALHAHGDIVITPVARHYVIGRVKADGQNQTVVEVQSERRAALERACQLVGLGGRVFLARADKHESTLVDCADLEPPFRRQGE